MLAGIYYGAQYGGSTTAILLNLPGEISSVVTTLEGYKMARNGRAGAALATSPSAPSSPARWPRSSSPPPARC
jgi:TctA family transporter